MMEFFDTKRASSLQEGCNSTWPENPTTRAAITASSLSGRISISDRSVLTYQGTGTISLTSACHLLILRTHQSFHTTPQRKFGLAEKRLCRTDT